MTKLRLELEPLEDRLVPYAFIGNWVSPALTYSFLPDGAPTDLGPSALYAEMAAYPEQVWKGEFRAALNTWADVSGLTFREVPDGDIRFGANLRLPNLMAMAVAYPPGPGIGGDVFLNTYYQLRVTGDYNLRAVLVHEIGHALGLGHSEQHPTVMYAAYTGLATLGTDDVAGVQALYGRREPPPPEPPKPAVQVVQVVQALPAKKVPVKTVPPKQKSMVWPAWWSVYGAPPRLSRAVFF